MGRVERRGEHWHANGHVDGVGERAYHAVAIDDKLAVVLYDDAAFSHWLLQHQVTIALALAHSRTHKPAVVRKHLAAGIVAKRRTRACGTRGSGRRGEHLHARQVIRGHQRTHVAAWRTGLTALAVLALCARCRLCSPRLGVDSFVKSWVGCPVGSIQRRACRQYPATRLELCRGANRAHCPHPLNPNSVTLTQEVISRAVITRVNLAERRMIG